MEASPIDRGWRIGFNEGVAGKKSDGWGMNILRRALTTARERLSGEDLVDADKDGKNAEGAEMVVEDDSMFWIGVRACLDDWATS